MQTSSSTASGDSQTQQLATKIADSCESLTYTTSGIFVASLFLTVLRPDPTLAVCLFGFYGAHVRSKGAIRSFWVFLLLTVGIDVFWLVSYSALRPTSSGFSWDMIQEMSRREQVAVALSALNVVYKLAVVVTAIRLQGLFSTYERASNESIDAKKPAEAGTSSGAPLDKRSLAAQDAV